MKKFFLFLITSLWGSAALLAQGCSDAGFCTIGNLALHQAGTAASAKNKLSLLLTAGVGDEDVFVVTPAIVYNRMFSKRWSAEAKVTANYATGNLGNAAGAGDVFLSGTYVFNPAASWKISATAGTKLPLSQSNLKEGNRSLPMQYQSSLGTVDLIAGIAASSLHWQLAAGWQQPLTGRNGNNFLPVYWTKPSANKYPPSNDFNRKGDVLLRTAYAFTKGSNWAFTGGVLGIYHIGKDTYIDGNISNRPIAINGSDGLTLNATATANYQFSAKWSVGITAGIPLVVRDVRPDGLTRSFAVSPQINYQF